MRTPTKKRPPLEMEPGEGKAHEMKETPEEKVREGTESEEGENYPKKSRKRSAKGAKSTKAPMDAECGCSGKGRKGKCDGSCGKAMKDGGNYPMKGRSDALTAPEYLAACDLGIQGRSRSYIRARLDIAERLDLKCGKGAISKGEKCTKGATQAVEKHAKSNRAPGLRAGQVYRGMTWGEQFNYLARTKAPGRKGVLNAREPVEGFIRQNSKAYAGWGAAGGAVAGTALGGLGIGTAVGAGIGAGAGAVAGAGLGALEAASATTFGYKYATPDRIKSRKKGKTYYQSGVIQRDSIYAKGFKVDLAQLSL